MPLSFVTDSEDGRRFRREVADWLQENLPRELRNLATRPPFPQAIGWHKKLHARGWIAPHWPRHHGGMGASLSQQMILRSELARIGAPEVFGSGLNHIGPLLMEFGTSEQKREHLPRILCGDRVWAQGYSEPNAGSDLASLRTAAVRQGDRFIVNGHKIWTTWAHNADWIFMLVRTNPAAVKKHAGITFLLCDLKTRGIRIRKIRTLAGEDELAEVFFDDVEVPVANVVGAVDDGWKVANALLAHERLGSSGLQVLMETMTKIEGTARATGAIEDEGFRARLASLDLQVTAVSAFLAHAVAVSSAEKGLGEDASIIKIASTGALQRAAELLVEAAAGRGAQWDRIDLDEDSSVEAARLMLQTRRLSIYGGTNEILKNIICKRVLRLP